MREDRAVSTTIGYVLTLVIATMLVAGLVGVGGSTVEDQREVSLREELTVVGQQLSGGVEMADRLVRSDDDPGTDPTVEITQQLPRNVVGGSYTISLVDPAGSDPHLELTSSSADVTVTVEVETTTPVAESSLTGGPVRIVYDTTLATPKLVIERA